VHSVAEDLYAIGAIDKATMRRFDKTCLTDVEELPPGEIDTQTAAPGAGTPAGRKRGLTQ
jgi:hypothetical protein